MAQGDTKTAKTTSSNTNTKLSVSAAAFVPSVERQAKLGLSPSELSSIPKYVTSCYPFVQEGSTTVRPNRWQTPTRSPQFAGQRMPSPDLFAYAGNRPAYTIPNHGIPNMHGFNIRQPFRATGPPRPVSPYQYPPGVYYHGPPTPAWGMPSAPPYQEHPPVPPGPQSMTTPPMVIYPSTVQGDRNTATSALLETSSSSVVDAGKPKVSVGVQNDCGTASSFKAGGRKMKTKTIILMDAAIQTDFSDDIANLTLAEKPNSLYKYSKTSKRPRRRNHPVPTGTSTDSEEVDSDSGYSSPLHRRNQTSSGTHPVGPSGLVCSDIRRLSGSFSYSSHSLGELSGSFSNSMFMSVPEYGHSLGSAQAAVSLQNYIPLTSSLSITSAESSISSGLSFNNANMLSCSRVVGSLPAETLSEPVPENNAQDGEIDANGQKLKRKRKRNRRRRRKTGGGTDVDALSDELQQQDGRLSKNSLSRASSEHMLNGSGDGQLHFEDEEEFPDLQSSSNVSNQASYTTRSFTYSDILKQAPSSPVPLSQEMQFKSQESYTSSLLSLPQSSLQDKTTGKDKNSRKRKKRQDQANKAAEVELAEISIEQEMLKEIGVQKHKSKQPVTLNIALMIDALEKQQEVKKEKQEKSERLRKSSLHEPFNALALNPLDSSAPAVKRGKEREVPKVKKPSSLKKVILKEREEKKKLKMLEDGTEVWETIGGQSMECDDLRDEDFYEDEDDDDEQPLEPISDLSQDGQLTGAVLTSYRRLSRSPVTFCSIPNGRSSPDALSSKASMASSVDMTASADLSPISQTSPIIMSPLSVSPLNSGINSPVAGLGFRVPEASLKIHSRRFREYCNQILDKDIDSCCTLLLQELVRFQDRLFFKDPAKAKSKRRIVLGLREVTKHLKLKKIKCVIISPNLERIQSKGGLDEALNNIIYLCSEQNIPFVFALGRRALGRACAKLVPVSVAGIFNFDGAEEHFKKLMELTVKARQAYKDMVAILEKESQDNSYMGRSSSSSMMLAHMGHSRTPSASSAISFSSSILSEPISENYPHSEPETDSKGNEVGGATLQNSYTGHTAVDAAELVQDSVEIHGSCEDTGGGVATSPRESAGSDISVDSRETSPDKASFMHDIDEGHEADTEDMNDPPGKSSWGETRSEESRFKDRTMKFVETHTDSGTEELPHIDSIHSASLDLSSEILSQHSSRTAELSTTEVLSTHSSKTLGEVSTLAERTVKQSLEEAVSTMNGVALGCQKSKAVNNDRIESWVAETATAMEEIKLSAETGAKDLAKSAVS